MGSRETSPEAVVVAPSREYKAKQSCGGGKGRSGVPFPERPQPPSSPVSPPGPARVCLRFFSSHSFICYILSGPT